MTQKTMTKVQYWRVDCDCRHKASTTYTTTVIINSAWPSLREYIYNNITLTVNATTHCRRQSVNQ